MKTCHRNQSASPNDNPILVTSDHRGEVKSSSQKFIEGFQNTGDMIASKGTSRCRRSLLARKRPVAPLRALHLFALDISADHDFWVWLEIERAPPAAVFNKTQNEFHGL
jgi:hypothetical protein